MKKIVKIYFFFVKLSLLCFSLSTCHTSDYGTGWISYDYYDFIEAISDTIKLVDQDAGIHQLACYKKETIRRNTIREEIEHDIYFEYDEYFSYYRSDDIDLILSIESIGNDIVYYSSLHYVFKFLLYDEFYYEFEFYREGSFIEDSVVTINGNNGGELKVQKSEGIILLNANSLIFKAAD